MSSAVVSFVLSALPTRMSAGDGVARSAASRLILDLPSRRSGGLCHANVNRYLSFNIDVGFTGLIECGVFGSDVFKAPTVVGECDHTKTCDKVLLAGVEPYADNHN